MTYGHLAAFSGDGVIVDGGTFGFISASSTTLTITAGAQSLTVASRIYSFVAGASVMISDPSAPTTRWMAGIVTAYNLASGALTVNVTLTQGSGSGSAWQVGLTDLQTLALVQGIISGVAQCVRGQANDTVTMSTIPAAASRHNKILSFGNTGQPSVTTNSLNNLSNVNISSATTGQVLGYSTVGGGTWVNETISGGSLAGLSDVSLSTPTGGQFLGYSTVGGGKWVNESVSGGSLATLSDVNVAGVTNGEVLGYDSATATWIPTVGGGGGGFNPTITSPQTGDIIQYEAGNWQNSALAAQTYVIVQTITGKPVANTTIVAHVFPYVVVFPSNLTDSRFVAGATSHDTKVFTLNLLASPGGSPTTVATLSFASGVATPSVTSSGFAATPGNILEIVCPAAQDPTLADLTFSIVGTQAGGVVGLEGPVGPQGPQGDPGSFTPTIVGSPANGQVIGWSSTVGGGAWTNVTVGGGGGGSAGSFNWQSPITAPPTYDGGGAPWTQIASGAPAISNVAATGGANTIKVVGNLSGAGNAIQGAYVTLSTPEQSGFVLTACIAGPLADLLLEGPACGILVGSAAWGKSSGMQNFFYQSILQLRQVRYTGYTSFSPDGTHTASFSPTLWMRISLVGPYLTFEYSLDGVVYNTTNASPEAVSSWVVTPALVGFYVDRGGSTRPNPVTARLISWGLAAQSTLSPSQGGFTLPPSLGTWAWVNQEGSSDADYLSVAGATIGTKIICAGGGDNGMHGLAITTGGSTFTLTAAILHLSVAGTSVGVGVGVRNSSGNNALVIGSFVSGTSVSVNRYHPMTTNPTTEATLTVTYPVTVWFQIVSDGTNVTCSVGGDGITWHQVYTEALSAFLLSIDQAMFYIESTTTAGGNGALLSWAIT